MNYADKKARFEARFVRAIEFGDNKDYERCQKLATRFGYKPDELFYAFLYKDALLRYRYYFVPELYKLYKWKTELRVASQAYKREREERMKHIHKCNQESLELIATDERIVINQDSLSYVKMAIDIFKCTECGKVEEKSK